VICINKVILLGRLTQDPECRYTQSGKAVTNFTLAVKQIGQKEADFIPVVLWEKLAETAANNLSKGQRVLIEGRIQTRSYETNDGQKRRVTEVVGQTMEFIEKKQREENNPFGGQVFPEEEIPF
jgi:single-strand DNA-binding protein